MSNNLKVDDIVNVIVSTAAPSTPRNGFNVGLIVGSSEHITPEERCKVYSDLASMETDGFLESDPEYKAAALYFAQSPAPGTLVVGRRDATDQEEMGGTPKETWVQAVTACRNANGDWYACYIAETEKALTSAEHQAVAAFIETNTAAYFFDDKSEGALAATQEDVFAVLSKLSLKRTCGLYSTTECAGAAVMGFAMGANTGTANSAYTLAYKSLTGVTPDDLTETQVQNLQSKHANYYIVRGGTYNVLEQGVMADGGWFDDQIGIDQLAYDLQRGCMDLLANTRTKIPYTDAGALQFIQACNEVCANAVTTGFIAPGTWTAPDVLDLATGDALEAGYLCQAESVAARPVSEKRARKCPPIYVCIAQAGAIHSVTIQVNVI